MCVYVCVYVCVCVCVCDTVVNYLIIGSMISGITFIIYDDSQEFGKQSNSINFSSKYAYKK